MWNAADIDRIGKDEVEVPAAERGSAGLPSVEHRAQLGSELKPLTLLLQASDAAELEIELEEQPDRFGLFGH